MQTKGSRAKIQFHVVFPYTEQEDVEAIEVDGQWWSVMVESEREEYMSEIIKEYVTDRIEARWEIIK